MNPIIKIASMQHIRSNFKILQLLVIYYYIHICGGCGISIYFRVLDVKQICYNTSVSDLPDIDKLTLAFTTPLGITYIYQAKYSYL